MTQINIQDINNLVVGTRNFLGSNPNIAAQEAQAFWNSVANAEAFMTALTEQQKAAEDTQKIEGDTDASSTMTMVDIKDSDECCDNEDCDNTEGFEEVED